MDLEFATNALRNKVGTDSGLGATLKFDCEDEGVIVIDAKSQPNSVSNTDRDTDCTITCTLATLGELMANELSPTTAFMTGRIKVTGDIGVALKLQKVL
ncbi:MAG: SCP2 sterol-binding domain-containing protein [Ideonella sp.]|nr:SCP2 sterol-binding domain-containing protein [Ideonella sp.]MCC7458532.1 SCP2 sterol-binding domain-containing protein [Nitrospira sp.]